MKIARWSAHMSRRDGWPLLAALTLLAAHDAAAQNNSLYDADRYRPFITDQRAAHVGDSLVVLVYESAAATNQTNVKVNKDSSIDLSATDRHNTVGAGFSAASDGEGGGIERRSGEVIARVSATIQSINANGEYLISGKQRISLNNESQIISVSGRVRPQDIDAGNAVISARIADANIEFIGQGLLSSREKPGMVSRFFNWLF